MGHPNTNLEVDDEVAAFSVEEQVQSKNFSSKIFKHKPNLFTDTLKNIRSIPVLNI